MTVTLSFASCLPKGSCRRCVAVAANAISRKGRDAQKYHSQNTFSWSAGNRTYYLKYSDKDTKS
jgi:hypothetical protein